MIKSSRYGRLLIFINSTMLMATLIEIYYLKTGTFHYIVNCANVLPFKLATTSEKPQQPHQHQESTPKDSEKFHVDTPVCKIPRTAIFPEYFQNNWNWMQKRMPDCSNEKQLFILSANETMLYLTYPEPSKCTLWEILRDLKDDHNFQMANRGIFQSHQFDLKHMEMFMVECNGKQQFEATIPMTNSAKEKVKFWEGREDRPTSVLIVGLDTTSRSHVYRSLPRTLRVLRDMKFEDFRGFHTIQPSTLPNFQAMLMGLTDAQVNGGCQPTWEDPYDNCHLIWDLFNSHNYITMYHEDGAQSFNWYGGGGFARKPVDYYAHPMFLSLLEMRKNKTFEKQYCTSSEQQPSFMLRYTERFLRKIMSTPFLAMTHIANPLHDSEKALPYLDLPLERLFLFMKAYPEIHENTLIVLFGDHGQRYGRYMSKGGFEAFLERSLVPLFVRLPENLRRKFPTLEFDHHLKHNTRMLTTAFDLHQTFLHILALNGLSLITASHDFQVPSSDDRSSLLLRIHSNRSCELVHIDSDACVCNALTEASVQENPYFIHKMIEYSVRLLNKLVKNSGFEKKCESWERATSYPLIAALNLKSESGISHVLLKFRADPGPAEFEIRLKLGYSGTELLNIEQMSNLTRINSYGNTSDCIEPVNPQAKTMKNFCYCDYEKDS